MKVVIKKSEIIKLLRTWREETEKVDWKQLARIANLLDLKNVELLEMRATIERILLQDILSEIRFSGPGMEAELSGWVEEPGHFALLVRAWGDFIWFQDAIRSIKHDLRIRWLTRTREDSFLTNTGEKGIMVDIAAGDPPILSVYGEGSVTEGGRLIVKIFSPERIGNLEAIGEFVRDLLQLMGARKCEWGRKTPLLGDIYVTSGIEGVKRYLYLPESIKDAKMFEEDEWLTLELKGDARRIIAFLLFFLFPLSMDQLFAMKETKGFIRKRWAYSIRRFVHKSARVSFEDDWVVIRVASAPEDLKKTLEHLSHFLEEEELIYAEGGKDKSKVWIKRETIEKENLRRALNALSALL